MSNIHHPAHYNNGQIEAIEVIEDWNLDFKLGNVVKYVSRVQHKRSNELPYTDDLRKAQWYIDRMIEEAENEEVNADSSS